jgi:hypothetical protein
LTVKTHQNPERWQDVTDSNVYAPKSHRISGSDPPPVIKNA